MKILLVDDDVTHLETLKRLFYLQLKANIETVTTTRGVQSKAEFFQPDVILLDLSLGSEPEHSGLPALRNLKRGHYTKNIPIIIVTGHKEPEVLKSVLMWGVDDYVLKPFDTTDLIERIKKVINKKKEAK